jgi:hypothetical protein
VEEQHHLNQVGNLIGQRLGGVSRPHELPGVSLMKPFRPKVTDKKVNTYFLFYCFLEPMNCAAKVLPSTSG